MLIFNHKYIDSPKFIEIKNIDEINKTTPKDILLLSQLKEPFKVAKHCRDNSLIYATKVNSIKESIFANSLNSTYIIANLELAKVLQNIANEYLWDAKILTPIKDDTELEKIALLSIDGVIYNLK